MLSLERVFRSAGGLALFGDHADPDLVYYMPVAPVLARHHGEPEFSLLTYTRDLSEVREDDPIGGGFLSFTVELRAEEDDLEAARASLREQGVANPRLAPIPVRGGKAVLASMGRRPAEDQAPDAEPSFVLFEETRGEVTPSLFGSQRALFGLVMPGHESAAIMKQLVLGEGTSPLGVRYELSYLGLRPAVHARVTADYRSFKRELSQKFDFGASYYGYGIEVKLEDTMRELMEDGSLKVEVTHFTDDEDYKARVDQALFWVQQRLVRDVFRPTLMPRDERAELMRTVERGAAAIGGAVAGALLEDAALLALAAEKIGIDPEVLRVFLASDGQQLPMGDGYFSFSLQFQRIKLEERLHKVLVFDYTAAGAEERIAAPQALMSFATKDTDLTQRVRHVDTHAPEFQNVRTAVQLVDDLEELGLERVLVHLAWPGQSAEGEETTHHTVSFSAGDTSPKPFGAFLDGHTDLSYRYRVESHFLDSTPWPGTSAVEMSAWQTTRSGELLIRPLEHVRRMELSLAPGTLDFEQTPSAQVELEHDGRTAVFFLTAEAPRHTWRLRLSDDAPVRARVTWTTAERTQIVGDWADVDGNLLSVPSPWRGQRTLMLMPMLPPDIFSATVTARLAEENNTREQIITFAPGARRPERLRLPTLSADPVPVFLDVVVVRADLGLYMAEGIEVNEPIFMVRDTDAAQRKISVRLLGTDFDAAGVSGVRVRLTDPVDASITLADVLFSESRRQPLTVLVPEPGEGAFGFGVSITRYDHFGTAHAEPWRTATDTTLVVAAPIPAADVTPSVG